MAKEIYSLDEDKMVQTQEPEKQEKRAEETEDELAQDEEIEEGDGDGDGEEQSEEDENPEHEEDHNEEQQDNETDRDAFIKENFGKDYDIENEDQFKEIIDRSIEILDENESLKAELKGIKEKPAVPVFKSKTQESVYNAIKDYDPERIPDGLHMIAGLVGMDLEKTDSKLILEQQFVMEHPELGLERARKKFQRRFEEKFVVNEETFDGTPAALKEKKEDLESDLEIEVAKAKKYIKEKQQEFKVKSEDKPESVEIAEPIKKSIASNATEFDKHMDGLTTLTVQADEDDDKNLFHYKFSKEELVKIKQVVNSHLKNHKDYDSKGNLIGGFDPEEKFQQAAFMIAGPNIIEEALKFAKKYAQVIKAEEIGGKKPKRVAKSSGDAQKMDIDSQAERLAEKKKAERMGK